MQKLKPTAGFFSIALLLILWQILAIVVDYPDLFPSVTSLLFGLGQILVTKSFYIALWHTLYRGLVGFCVALLLAAGLSAIALNSKFLKAFIHPWIVIARSIPVISIVLIALLWLSPPGLPIFIAFFTMFPILYQNFLTGLEQTDRKLLEMAKVLNKTAIQKLRHIYFPSAQAYIFSGMATAMGFGWRSVIIGEVLAGPIHGIGTSMKKAQAFIEMKDLLAWTVIAILISFVFDFILKKLADKSFNPKLKIKEPHKHFKPKNTDLKKLNLSNLNKSFNSKEILSNFSTEIENDAIHLLQSASGSGKTTLFNILSGIIKADGGKIIFKPEQAHISYAYQDIRLIPWLSIEQNIAFSLPSYPKIPISYQSRLNDLMLGLALEKHRGKFPDELSGGEQQRVNLARAIIFQSDLLLLDEPLNGVEASLRGRLIHFIEDWTACYKPLILWATHLNMDGLFRQTVKELELPLKS